MNQQVISDAAVEAACASCYGDIWPVICAEGFASAHRDTFRKILSEVLPYLAANGGECVADGSFLAAIDNDGYVELAVANGGEATRKAIADYIAIRNLDTGKTLTLIALHTRPVPAPSVADEREACAALCNAMVDWRPGQIPNANADGCTAYHIGIRRGLVAATNAIRARASAPPPAPSVADGCPSL